MRDHFDSENGLNGFERVPDEAYADDFNRSYEGPTLVREDNMARFIAPEAANRATEIASSITPIGQIKPMLERNYLIKGWLDRDATSVVYGESNVGKSFFALDLAMHVATGGWDWHGTRSGGGGVLYIAGEGGNGIKNRIAAIRSSNPELMQAAQDGGFLLLSTALDLCTSGDAEQLLKVLGDEHWAPSLIIVDTLARSMGGGDENTAKDMSAFIRNIDALRGEDGAHVMVIHHSGKDTSKGARGSGALRAAVDTEIEITRDGPVIMAESRKQRDKATGAVFAYTLQSVVLGTDEDGDDVTSAVVQATEAPAKRAPKLTGQALIAMQAFGDALADHGVTKTGEAFPSNRQCVSLENWREYCDRHSLSSGNGDSASRVAFHRAWKNLQEKQIVRVLDGFAWRCADE